MRDRSRSGLFTPLGGAPGGFPAHSMPLGTVGGPLRCLQCGCELGPRAPVWSPILLGRPAQLKDGSSSPQRELLALQRDKRVR